MNKEEEAQSYSSGNQADAPPPPSYSSNAALPSYSASNSSKLHTLDGTIDTAQSFRIQIDDIGIAESRTLELIPLENSVVSNPTPAYHVSYTGDNASSMFKTKGMEIRQQNATGPLLTRVALDDEMIVGEMKVGGNHLVLKKPDSKSRLSNDDKPDKSTVLVEGLPVFPNLRWVSTDHYLHSHKGKGKGGDAHLIAGESQVLAIFLNQWENTSSQTGGELHVMEPGMEILEIVVASLVVMAERSYMSKRKVNEAVKKTAFTALACSVM